MTEREYAQLRKRLVVHERAPATASGRKGRILSYLDPRTGEILTQRKLQTIRNGGLTPEAAALVRRSPQLQREIERTRRMESFGALVQRWERMHGTRGQLGTLRDPKFWQAVRDLRSSSRSPKGKKARALEAFGLRPPGAPQRVGDSPPQRRPVPHHRRAA